MPNTIDIKEMRRLKGWTQRQMADEFGVDLSTVWRWEKHGVPTRGPARRAIEEICATTETGAEQGAEAVE